MKNQAAFLAHVYNYISIYTLRSIFTPSTKALAEIGKRQFAASIKFFISTSDNSTWHSQISSVKKQSKTRLFRFFFSHRLHNYPERHTFASFFMVLDLRLVKIGCRETINFFCLYTSTCSNPKLPGSTKKQPHPLPFFSAFIPSDADTLSEKPPRNVQKFTRRLEKSASTAENSTSTADFPTIIAQHWKTT